VEIQESKRIMQDLHSNPPPPPMGGVIFNDTKETVETWRWGAVVQQCCSWGTALHPGGTAATNSHATRVTSM
jgi:hypothetical protein